MDWEGADEAEIQTKDLFVDEARRSVTRGDARARSARTSRIIDMSKSRRFTSWRAIFMWAIRSCSQGIIAGPNLEPYIVACLLRGLHSFGPILAARRTAPGRILIDRKLRNVESMPHHFVTHEHRDQALLYALGLLEAEERQALEDHMHDGCGTCESEVKSFEAVVEELSYCACPFPPPSRLRQRLLDQVSNQLTSLAPGECLSAVRLKESRGHGMGTNLAPAHFCEVSVGRSRQETIDSSGAACNLARRSPSSPFGD